MRLGGRRWQHPELQPGWIDRPHQTMSLGELPLESGEAIRDFEISYVTHGTRAVADDNVILILTAIGSTHHRLDFLIGAGRPLLPDRHFIICIRVPGALQGVAADAIPGLVEQAIAAARRVSADPLDWIYQSWAYDAHDVGTTPSFGGDAAAALRTVKAPALFLVPRLDLYNPVEDAIEAATLVPNARLVHLDGCAGHAVAADTSSQLDDIRVAIGKFLNRHADRR
jgi:homoserine acetyltransferase